MKADEVSMNIEFQGRYFTYRVYLERYYHKQYLKRVFPLRLIQNRNEPPILAQV
jgi:hypothetical protein